MVNGLNLKRKTAKGLGKEIEERKKGKREEKRRKRKKKEEKG